MSNSTYVFTDIAELEDVLIDEHALQKAEHVVDKVAIEAELAKLTDEKRDMIYLLYAYKQPGDYPMQWSWPASTSDVCRYLGGKYNDGHVLPVSTLWYRHNQLLKRWRTMHDFYTRLPRLGSVVDALARKLSGGDSYLKDELTQSGLALLWKLKLPDSLKPKDTEEELYYIKRALRNRMNKVRKRELKKRM